MQWSSTCITTDKPLLVYSQQMNQKPVKPEFRQIMESMLFKNGHQIQILFLLKV